MVRAISTVLAACALLVSSAAAQNLVAGACVLPADLDATTDYFPNKVDTTFTDAFTVEYKLTYKVVTNVAAGETYVLYQCGTKRPVVKGAKRYISVPVTAVALGDTTFIPRLEQLGERAAIKAYTGTTDFITSPCINALVKDGSIEEAFFTPANTTECFEQVNNTQLQALDVGVTFVSAFGTTSCGRPIYNSVVISDLLEVGSAENDVNLAILEWLKFVAVFFNREAEANALVDEIEGRWNCTVDNAGICADVLKNKPTVAWSPGYIDGSGWLTNTDNSYYVQAVDKAGGDIVVCVNGTGQPDNNFYMTDEEFLACNGKADVCIFAQDYDTITETARDVLNQLDCVKNKRVFDNQRNGPLDWFESRFAQPDTLLQDIVMAIHNENTQYGIGFHDRVWLRAINESDSYTAPKCTNVTAPFESTANVCIDVIATECAVTDAADPKPTVEPTTNATEPAAEPDNTGTQGSGSGAVSIINRSSLGTVVSSITAVSMALLL